MYCFTYHNVYKGKHMSLRKKQSRFTLCMAKLVIFAYEQGWELTDGDAYRDERLHGKFGERKGYGASQSMHKIKLANDKNLFVDGKYITDSKHPAFVKLGEFWESLDPDACWGGRFNDANHFSFTHWGCK